MSEAHELGDNPAARGGSVHLDLRGLLEAMRDRKPDLQPDLGPVPGSASEGADAAEAEGNLDADGDSAAPAYRVVGRRIIRKITIPGATPIIYIDRETEIVVDAADHPQDPEPAEDALAEDKTDGSVRSNADTPEEAETAVEAGHGEGIEVIPPLGLGKTLRVLGGKAFAAARKEFDGFEEVRGEKADRQEAEWQRAEAVRQRLEAAPKHVRHLVRNTRRDLDKYFKLMAKGGLGMQNGLPATVQQRLRLLEELNFPYYGDAGGDETNPSDGRA